MSKRKNLKAYVRLDKNRKPIPGSLIYRKDKPYGKFAPMVDPSGDICCGTQPVPIQQDCSLTPKWYSRGYLTPLPVEGGIEYGYTNGIISDRDYNCNVVRLGRASIYLYSDNSIVTNYAFSLEKFDSAGTLTWSKFYLPVINSEVPDSPYFSPISMQVDAYGNIFVLGRTYITKIDQNGNVLWSNFKFSPEFPANPNNNATFDFKITDNSRVYALVMNKNADDSVWTCGIWELDYNTGAVINNKDFSFSYPPVTTADIYYGYCFNIDGQGNILGTINAYGGGPATYVVGVFKTDPDLNLLWFKLVDVVNDNYAASQDCEVTDIVADKDNNIILSLWWAGMIWKLDPDGNILWQTSVGTTTTPTWTTAYSGNQANCPVDADGNIYAIGFLSSTDFTPAGVPLIYVAKINPSGVLQWAYGINPDDSIWTSGASHFSQIKEGVLYLTANKTNASLFKLPLTLVTGTFTNPSFPFDSYTFTDITSSMLLTPSAGVMRDVTPLELSYPVFPQDGTFQVKNYEDSQSFISL